MSNHKNLKFFNKEGDYLNFQYSEYNDRFEGDILFNENSTDTFKTYAIYTLENIPSFDFESPGELTTKKFQLFNEYGLHFYANKYYNQSMLKIEPVNNDPSFYTKWIYGESFDAKFPVGTLVKFKSIFLEFMDLSQTYTVVGSKPGAIMILTKMDNSTFETTYYDDYTYDSFIIGKLISGVNAVGVYDYIDNSYKDRLSNWNEPDFYEKYYVGKKLNIIGSDKNDGVLTITDVDLSDNLHFEYSVDKNNLPVNSDLIIEVITRTDVPMIYNGSLNIINSTMIIGDFNDYPSILKPGTEFKIIGSVNNDNFFTVADIPNFNNINSIYYFATQSQVIYNNKIYQCVKGYTQSFGSSVAYVTPLDSQYWSKPTHIKVSGSTSDENLLYCQLYLTTDRFYYTCGWTHSAEATLASAAEKYHTDLEIFNIDLFYLNGKLRSDLMYPSKYAEINFYHTSLGATYSIGSVLKTSERLVEVSNQLTYELNYNYSQNKIFNIVFTDIDEFGIKVTINGMLYDEEAALIYTGYQLDMDRTIDRTLRNWLSRWYLTLFTLGINIELQYTGGFNSIFYNSILIKSTYPNVPLVVNHVQVGTTADFYVEHSKVLFNDMGPYLNIKINNKNYGQTSSFFANGSPDIASTLANWEEAHYDFLLEYNIRVNAVNTILKFNLSNLDGRLDYTISTGKLNLPGVNDYTISKKLQGNEGVLIASNEIVLPSSSSYSFEESGFATGMAFTVNNTAYPFVNQDFTIQYLDPTVLNLSYQGPFWSLTQSACNLSGFMTIAFDNGFGQQNCIVPVAPTGGALGEFDPSEFDPSMFSVVFNQNSYNFNSYDLNGFQGTGNLVDIMYLQLVGCVYGLGDGVVVLDAFYGNYLSTISLPGNTQSIEMEYNSSGIISGGGNDYLYCLSKDYMWVVDPTSNLLISQISFTASGYKAYQIEINPDNGDVYVSYENRSAVDIWKSNNFTNIPSYTISSGITSGDTRAMVYNEFENDMYITGTNEVIRVNGVDRTIQTVYGITGVTHSIFYEPVYEAIYVYAGTGLYKIDNGISQSIGSLPTTSFQDMIFNNLTGEMNISDDSLDFTKLDLLTNSYQSSNIANYGYLSINQFDGDIYLSSQLFNSIVVMSGDTGQVVHSQALSAKSTKIIYNPERKSVWAIQPSINSFVEIQVDLNISLTQTTSTYSVVGDNLYGTLHPDHKPKDNVWLKTRDYFRRPRENFEGDVTVKYYWKWISDGIPEFFLYDFSGDQLKANGDYTYMGDKPLPNVVLNKSINKDITKVSYPEYQQTVFDTIEYDLSYIDDETDISVEAESLELFIGFKAEEEGAVRSVLQLYKKEEVDFTIISDSSTYLTFDTILDGDKRGVLKINDNSSETFTNRGLKSGQNIVIYVSDITNQKHQYISDNNGLIVIIREVYTKTLIVDFFNGNFDYLEKEQTILNDYPSVGKSTYLKINIIVRDKEIGRFVTYGQTEEEDERFKVELGNIGKLISTDELFIFKNYDINEGGVDWIILNKKRKEMLMNRNLIYPYIGAYKSLVNAINYFGYNDLQLNEYYLNQDTGSKNFGKLFKVEIPDMFDNTIKGWNEKDFLMNDLPDDKFESTNSFNLTYFITDKEGNYILNYSLDEIVIKLQGLKYWLKRNIIPLTHKILDITGSSYFNGGSHIRHNLYDIIIVKMKEEMTPITFKLNEVYLYPVNSGSTIYNCVLDLYSIIEGVGADKNTSDLVDPVKPYNDSLLNLKLPDTYDIKVRTYKVYKEWVPFKTYDNGDKVIYYDKLYESVKDGNRINNPLKYKDVGEWIVNVYYSVSNVVKYQREYYSYSGLGDTESNLSPNLDPYNWFRLTDWVEIDFEPVQYITEFRNGDDLKPFNFTIDSNIDPFLVIEVVSHNGYGQTWGDKKNYFIKGLKDLSEPYSYIDPIGPFVPIEPVY
jgi:hypothetical protein